jgi:hypothetical protein
LPASPRTPPSPPIPEFNLLVTPPLQSQAPVRPLLVYSRRRFHLSRTPSGPATTTTATPPLASTRVAPAAATMLSPAVAGEPFLSAEDAGVILEAPTLPPASTSVGPAASNAGPPHHPPPTPGGCGRAVPYGGGCGRHPGGPCSS